MFRKLALLSAIALVATACGGGASDTTVAAPATTLAVTTTPTPTTAAALPTSAAPTTTATAPAGFPVVVAGATLDKRPERIISMSSTSTEILFAIGAGSQVVAVDSLSNYPLQAPTSDLNAYEASVEAMASYEPDLVIIFADPGDVVSGLETVGIPVIQHVAATSLDDAYAQIAELGIATGNVDGAAEVIAGMRASIDALVAKYQMPAGGLTYYHEVDNTYYSATSQTFIGGIYSLFGLENIADPADAAGSGFPQLSPEYIIAADPDLIFYGCAVWCGTNADTIAQRPGWDQMAAVELGLMAELDDDIASRWGPRLVTFVELVGRSIATALSVGGE